MSATTANMDQSERLSSNIDLTKHKPYTKVQSQSLGTPSLSSSAISSSMKQPDQ